MAPKIDVKAKLTADRGHLRGKVTRTHSNLDEVRVEDAQAKLVEFRELKSKLNKLDDQYLEYIFDPDNQDSYVSELNTIDEYNSKLTFILEKLRSILPTSNNSAHSSSEGGAHSNGTSNVKLKPTGAQLPKYNDKLGSLALLKFFAEFEEIVKRYNYGDYEQWVLLKSQLSGRPLDLLETLSTRDNSYAKAKELLTAAYANADVLKFEAIQRLLDLKNCDKKDAFWFATQMKMIAQEISFHKIKIDDILQFCFLSYMDPTLKQALIAITNNNHPSAGDGPEWFKEPFTKHVLSWGGSYR